ncbi:hypothetical protein [Streptomyces sp. NPDC059928]|uniref:hypothetical protein n=1 Tax=unclassified Streptomyces TaxID=2593676 RepID=UPI00364938CB
MLLRLAYFGVTNAFAMLRLLSMNDRDKAVEILALRHQITALERQLGGERCAQPEVLRPVKRRGLQRRRRRRRQQPPPIREGKSRGRGSRQERQ